MTSREDPDDFEQLDLMFHGLDCPEQPNNSNVKMDLPQTEGQPKSIIARRKPDLSSGLTIPIGETTQDNFIRECPYSSSNTVDSGFADGELSGASTKSSSLIFPQPLTSTCSLEDDLGVGMDEVDTAGSASSPIDIPLPIPGNRSTYVPSYSEVQGVQSSFPNRPIDNPWSNVFSSVALTASPRSVSFAICRGNAGEDESPRSRSLGQASRRASESHLIHRPLVLESFASHGRLRSASGSSLPSPSRSVGTQTPTGTFHFDFPDPDEIGDQGLQRHRPRRYMLPDVVPGIKTVPHHPTYDDENLDGGIESVGQQLRSIGDDFDRVHFSRSRNTSLLQLFLQGRRRSSAP